MVRDKQQVEWNLRKEPREPTPERGPMPGEQPQVATTLGSMIPKERSTVAALCMATALDSTTPEEHFPAVLRLQETRLDITMRKVALQEARDRKFLFA